MSKRWFLFVFIFLFVGIGCNAQRRRNEKTPLALYFENYKSPLYSFSDAIKIEDIYINNNDRQYTIYLNEAFKSQPFTPTIVKSIYEDVRRTLEPPYNSYQIAIYAQDVLIEQLIPIDLLAERDSLRIYTKNMNKGNSWVTPINIPYSINKGLKGRHLSVWASHGKYYNIKKGEWAFQ